MDFNEYVKVLRDRHPTWVVNDDPCSLCDWAPIVKMRPEGRWVCLDPGCEASAG